MFSVTLLTSYPCRVASFSEANKMPLESLAKIFGPTLVGHASAKPDPSVQWKDAEKQPKVCIIIQNAAVYCALLNSSPVKGHG